jgi:hypothetical protein
VNRTRSFSPRQQFGKTCLRDAQRPVNNSRLLQAGCGRRTKEMPTPAATNPIWDLFRFSEQPSSLAKQDFTGRRKRDSSFDSIEQLEPPTFLRGGESAHSKAAERSLIFRLRDKSSVLLQRQRSSVDGVVPSNYELLKLTRPFIPIPIMRVRISTRHAKRTGETLISTSISGAGCGDRKPRLLAGDRPVPASAIA